MQTLNLYHYSNDASTHVQIRNKQEKNLKLDEIYNFYTCADQEKNRNKFQVVTISHDENIVMAKLAMKILPSK